MYGCAVICSLVDAFRSLWPVVVWSTTGRRETLTPGHVLDYACLGDDSFPPYKVPGTDPSADMNIPAAYGNN